MPYLHHPCELEPLRKVGGGSKENEAETLNEIKALSFSSVILVFLLRAPMFLAEHPAVGLVKAGCWCYPP